MLLYQLFTEFLINVCFCKFYYLCYCIQYIFIYGFTFITRKKGKIILGNLLAFCKKQWKYILVAFIALVFGGSFGPTSEQYDALASSNSDLRKEIEDQAEKNQDLIKDNKELKALVLEAAPFFELSEQEQENKQKEAVAKAAELKKQEEARAKEEAKKAEEEARKAEEQAAAEAQAELAARTKTLTAGKYVVGRDIDAGLYDAIALAGTGNFVVTGGYTGLKVNEMFGLGDADFYNSQFNNLDLEDGDEIEINSNLKIKFEPKE
jgi:hypothetical protein